MLIHIIALCLKHMTSDVTTSYSEAYQLENSISSGVNCFNVFLSTKYIIVDNSLFSLNCTRILDIEIFRIYKMIASN